MRKSFVITAARDSSGQTFRFTIGAHALVVVVLLVLGFPALFFAGTSWGASAMISDLLRQNAALQAENANYRDATAQLAAQVSSLQDAADTLRAAAQLDPQVGRAMERLPASITHRAMGGGTFGPLASSVSGAVTAGDPAFGLLRDVLHVLQGQLDRFRPGAERRQALAAATPSIWPVTGDLSSQYGTRRDPFTGFSEFHAGLDIAARPGQPVQATADGKVLSAGWNGAFGNLVVIDHGFGISTRYGHLSRFSVVAGQLIKKGETVGYVGSTGRSTSPHVHYELLLNGRPANPLRFLTR